VIAHSFARIFYRNGFNMGLVLLEVGDDYRRISEGDQLEVDVEQGRILNATSGESISVPALPEFMLNLLRQGGLVEYVRQRLSAEG
jgi:3-isopropylmalate/(R)-2-methylmalate dehydratase small subunit